jgi:hypothetical protein
MLMIPNGGIDRVAPLHPQTPSTPAAPKETPEQAALSYAITHRLTKPDQQATLAVTAGATRNLFGAEVKANGSASVSVTYKGGGNYEVTLSQTQEAGVKVASGDGKDPKPTPTEKGSGQTVPKGTPGGIVLGPGPGDDRPPVEPVPPNIGVVPVSGPFWTGITAPKIGIFAQTKPPQQGEGSKGQAQVTPPAPFSVQTTPSVSAESTVDVTSTVTVKVHGAGAAVKAANAFATMAAQPRPGSFVDNPIMDQINGKSGTVAGVDPATLDFLKQRVENYGETITGSGSVVAGLKTSFGTNSLNKLGVSLQTSQQASLSRTVTVPNGSTPGSVAYAVSAQTSTQPTTSAFGTSSSSQGSQQASFTQTFKLNTKEYADPEHALTVANRWLQPDEVQQTFQTQIQLGATADLPKGSSAGDSLVRTTTTTATLQNPHAPDLKQAAQALQSNSAHPPSNFSVTTQTSTVDNNTIGVGSDWPVSGSLTVSKPV